MATTIKANYEVISGLKAGDLLTNSNGKRKLTIIEKTIDPRRNRSGYNVEITEKDGQETFTYNWFLTWGEIETRFPIKVENSRYDIKNLTEAQMLEVLAILGKDVKIAKVA